MRIQIRIAASITIVEFPACSRWRFYTSTTETKRAAYLQAGKDYVLGKRETCLKMNLPFGLILTHSSN